MNETKINNAEEGFSIVIDVKATFDTKFKSFKEKITKKLETMECVSRIPDMEHFGRYMDGQHKIFDKYIVYSDGTISNGKITMKQSILNGYCTITVQDQNGIRRFYTVSRLLGEIFYGKHPGKVINHINGNTLDNRIENLEWVSQKYNIQHALENNLIKVHSNAVLQYDKAGNLIAKFNSTEEAGKSIGLSRYAISKAINGDNNTAGGYIWKYADDNKERTEVDLKEFVKIKDYESYYVNKKGEIYNLSKKRFLKPVKNKNGHCYVTLCIDKEKKNMYIHTIVANHFLDNPNKKKLVRHKNNIKDDNKLENLEWI